MSDASSFVTSFASRTPMTVEERRLKRQQQRNASSLNKDAHKDQAEERFQNMLARNEDELLEFVAKVNSVYQDVLKKDAPFMTFVFCGMQSAGKSTIMERFLNAALNIVQEGTGTRCPLDTTCIHDGSLDKPSCELFGEELSSHSCGQNLTVREVFERITTHNQKLAKEDSFSTQSLRLIFRSSTVQNMRFVDTPGIISNKSTGNDNREDIKKILQSEMRKTNSKLCVLLDPKEFATNPIIDFCDDTFGHRDDWMPDATFLMTKFDMKIHDSRTANKANSFFKEYIDNGCLPFLVTTPTLENEKLPPEELYKERIALLEEADGYEKEEFRKWLCNHEKYRKEHGDTEELESGIASRVGFAHAKSTMRQVMLQDTLQRLPEVLSSLRKDLEEKETELKQLSHRIKFNDPNNVKDTVSRMLYEVQLRMKTYLDGNLEVGMKFKNKHQTLADEIFEEEESDWADKELNFHSEKENAWRDNIADMEDYPDQIQPEGIFLGGKQYQRAIGFFREVMLESMPDPYELKELVPTATGYLGGSLQNENWENAMVNVTQTCLRNVSHPGINYLIKHIGCIFRRLFEIAIDDVRLGERYSSEFQLIAPNIERFLRLKFDEMLWALMINCANQTHSFLEPMYSTIDPTLPTFNPRKIEVSNDRRELFVKNSSGNYEEAKKAEEEPEEGGWFAWIKSLRSISNDANQAKEILREESKQRAKRKQCFLPDERSPMITQDETNVILQRSFDYMIGLMEFNLVLLKFQLNHNLFNRFKEDIGYLLLQEVSNADWECLVQKDESLDEQCKILEKQIEGLRNSLRDVQKMQRNF